MIHRSNGGAAWLLAALLASACDEGPGSRGGEDAAAWSPDAASSPDGAPAPDAAPDAAAPPDATPDAGAADAALDALPLDSEPADAEPLDAEPLDAAAADAEPDAALPPEAAPHLLALADAEIEGPHDALADSVLLDPGARLVWTLDAPPDLGGLPDVALDVRARVWRVEDGHLTVRWQGEAFDVEVPGTGDAGWHRATVLPAADEGPGWGTAWQPPPLRLPTGGDRWTLEVEAAGGTIEVFGARLADRRTPLPEDPPPAPAEGAILDVAPCAEAGCDDAAGLREAIAAAPPGPLTIRLAAEIYTLRTSLDVTRPHVTLQGAPPGPEGRSPTVLLWDPQVAGQRHALRFAGRGLGGDAAPVRGAVAAGSRRFVVDAPPAWAPEHVWITADDFGEVPPVCVGGRDVERFHRHLGQLARVIAVQPGDDGTAVTVDRPLYLDVPAEARPRLVPATLLPGAAVRDLHLLGRCPEALDNRRHADVRCANPEVLDDDGLAFDWTTGARADGVSAQALGKFAIRVQRALDTRLADCSMDHPAAFGDGGEGYGVHLITASRTLVLRQRVTFARHGVVVDFGSSDSQIVGGRFADMNQALIDVHGEASRDTLIRGNHLEDALLGIIVGGGGREVHCNDGPRHHVQGNTVRACDLAAISLSDFTRGLWVRGNDVADSAVLFTAAFGGGDALLERNRFGAAGARAVLLTGEGSGGVVLRRNLFTDVCDEAAAALATLGAQPPVLTDNTYCQ